MKNWDILKSTYIYSCKWLTVRKDHVRTNKNIDIEDFYVLEYPDWINVIAITENGLFIIEEQYRHGIRKVDYELCAGVKELSETPLEAAKRELLEETGYGDGEWIEYGQYAPNTSSMNNTCYTFIARGLRKICRPRPEDTEDIKVHLMTLSEIKQLLITNKIEEAVMQAPLWRYIAENTSK